MSDFVARWLGLPDVRSNFQKLIEQIEKQGSRRAINKAATPVVKEMRRRVPVRTGNLKRSLGKSIRQRGKQVFAKIGARRGKQYGGASRRAHLVEFGTIKMSPRAFMRPAFRASKDEAYRVYRDSIAADITSVAKTKLKKYRG